MDIPDRIRKMHNIILRLQKFKEFQNNNELYVNFNYHDTLLKYLSLTYIL